jgi:nucleoside-diphosphate-sugar epimerase
MRCDAPGTPDDGDNISVDAVTGAFGFTGKFITRRLLEGGREVRLVATDAPATGATKLSQWLDQHAGEIGRVYASELARHYR